MASRAESSCQQSIQRWPDTHERLAQRGQRGRSGHANAQQGAHTEAVGQHPQMAHTLGKEKIEAVSSCLGMALILMGLWRFVCTEQLQTPRC